MPNYAHNTLISFLYEMGVVGVDRRSCCCGARCSGSPGQRDERSRDLLLGGHLSFLVLNLATMAHWQVEGNILYGLLSRIHDREGAAGTMTKALVERQCGAVDQMAAGAPASAPALVSITSQ